MNLKEKQVNDRYKQYAFESRQESNKTKENTISRYTKDSEISSDKNKLWGNRFSGDQYNIQRYKENNDNNKDNKGKGNNENNNIEEGPIIKRHFHTKKTRKDYINEKINKKNNEMT